MTMAILAALYLIGAVGTFIFNRMIIVGPVVYPWSVVRNAALWPFYLPGLIRMSREKI